MPRLSRNAGAAITNVPVIIMPYTFRFWLMAVTPEDDVILLGSGADRTVIPSCGPRDRVRPMA